MTNPPPVLDRLSTLADSTRSRLLLILDRHEVTVGELCAILQLPQSTVSRHLKVLSDDHWIVSRAEGTSRYYRRNPLLVEGAQRLWDLVRDDVIRSAVALEDAQRADAVIAGRRSRSQEFFTTAAARWDALRRDLYGDRQDVSILLALLDPEWTVGDLGCGTGNLASILSGYVKRVIAVDGSEAMLAAAGSRLSGVPNVDLRLGELETLPVENGVLDAALLSLVLHYVAEPPRALAEAHRVLKPGGRLAVLEMLPHARDDYRQQMGHIWQGFGEGQMKDWLTGVGFQDVRVRSLPVDERAKGPALFVAAGTRPG